MPYWETFLRIEPLADEAPVLDEAWCAARGVSPLALPLIRHLRRDVLPLIRKLEGFGLFWYCFLVHDRSSGVPTTEDDRDPYIHLRFELVPKPWQGEEDMLGFLSSSWKMTRQIELPDQIAGLNLKYRFDAPTAWRIIASQSRWLLELIEEHGSDVDDGTVLQHVRQFLHYFANATQIRVA
jgi:hypothetical protein